MKSDTVRLSCVRFTSRTALLSRMTYTDHCVKPSYNRALLLTAVHSTQMFPLFGRARETASKHNNFQYYLLVFFVAKISTPTKCTYTPGIYTHCAYFLGGGLFFFSCNRHVFVNLNHRSFALLPATSGGRTPPLTWTSEMIDAMVGYLDGRDSSNYTETK